MKQAILKVKKVNLRELVIKDIQALKKLEKLGEKINKAWKSKKTALELIQEGRR